MAKARSAALVLVSWDNFSGLWCVGAISSRLVFWLWGDLGREIVAQ